MKNFSVRLISALLIALLSFNLFNISCGENKVLAADEDPELESTDMVKVSMNDEKIFIDDALADEMIIGKDDRKAIKDTFKFPYSAIANIKMSFECGHSGGGTGFMISENVLATAGHCVNCPYCRKKLKTIEFRFGYDKDRNDSMIRISGCKNYYYDNDFIDPSSDNVKALSADYGFIEFDKKIGNITGYFGIRAFSDKDLKNKEFTFAGYRADYNPLMTCKGKVTPGIYLYKGSKKLVKIAGKTMHTSADIVAGNSGGPIYDKDNYAAGIISAEVTNLKYNVGRRITSDNMKFLKDKGFISSSKSSKPKTNIEIIRFYSNNKDLYVNKNQKTMLKLFDDLDAVKWSVKDSSIATIDDLGIVTAKKIGDTIITCEYHGSELLFNLHVSYKDVKDPSKFWYDPTYDLTAKDIVKGYDNMSSFKPANVCTRAQMVTFLWRLMGSPKPKSSKCRFTDVKKTDYFYKAVIWGNEQGVVEGYKDGTFGPQKTCQRKHAVTFLWRLAGSPEPSSSKNKFKDVKKSDYFYKPVLWASGEKIVAGYEDGTFKPNGKCLRRQMVTFLYKFSYCACSGLDQDIYEREPNDDYKTATNVNLGVKVIGEIGSYDRRRITNKEDEDWYSVSVKKGHKYRFNMPGYMKDYGNKYLLIVVNSDTNDLDKNDACLSNDMKTAERDYCEFEATKTGRIYIHFFNYSALYDNDPTDYTFKLEEV